jgi:Protein of unknown function (DUF2905)
MELGKLLAIFGVILVVSGILVMLLGRMNLPLGRLPGDFLYRGKDTTVYFPLATVGARECGAFDGAMGGEPVAAMKLFSFALRS